MHGGFDLILIPNTETHTRTQSCMDLDHSQAVVGLQGRLGKCASRSNSCLEEVFNMAGAVLERINILMHAQKIRTGVFLPRAQIICKSAQKQFRRCSE